jgi:FkbM family methyltransferase
MLAFHDYAPVESCQISGWQAILAGIFGLKKDGTFVEVGAWDGKEFSNVWQLAEMGWLGVCFEPMPDLYERCCGNHKDHSTVTVVPVALGSQSGQIKIFNNGDIFTADQRFMDAYGGVWNYVQTAEVTTLDAELNRLDWPANFDLLSVDVEGYELDVLAGIDLEFYQPKLVTIETHHYHPNYRLRFQADMIKCVMQEHGYSCIYSDCINDIYLRTI